MRKPTWSWEGIIRGLGFTRSKRRPQQKKARRLIAERLEGRQMLTALFWDADGDASSAVGGSGTWDSSSSCWRVGSETGTLTSWQAGSDAVFPGTAGTVSMGSGVSVNAPSITFQTSGYTIQSNTLSVPTGGTTSIDVQTGTATISSVITGSGALEKAGSGMLKISGTNTYTGDTTISAGTLKAGSVGAIPHGSNKGNLSISSGATFDLGGCAPSINGLSGSGTVDNSVGASMHRLYVGYNDVSSTFDGVIRQTIGTVSLDKRGTGTLTLNGTNTYTSQTIISAGTLKVGQTSGNSNAIPNSSYLMINGSGTLELSGSNETVSSIDAVDATTRVIINGGKLTVSDTTYFGFAGVISGTGALCKSNTGALYLSGANTYSGGTTLSGGSITIARDSVGSLGNITSSPIGTGTLTLTGGSIGSDSGNSRTLLNPVSLGGNVTFGDANEPETSLTFSAAAALTSNATLTTDGDVVLSGVVSGSYGLTKAGDATLTLGGANTYTGDTTISAGTLKAGSSDAIPHGSNKGNLSISSGATFDLGGCAPRVNGLSGSGTVDNSVGASMHRLYVGYNDVSSTFDGVIRQTIGTVSLDKRGTGTLTLNGTNTYTSQTIISAGTLKVGQTSGNSNAIPNSSYLMINGSGTLELSGSNETVSSIDAVDTTTRVIINGGKLTVSDTTYFGFAGVISGTGALVKSNTGMLYLSGANTYSGGTTLSGGSITIARDSVGSLGSITSSPIGTGTLTLTGGSIGSDSGNSRTLLNPVSLGGNVTFGDADVPETSLTFSAGVALTSNATMTTDGDVILSGVVSGSYGLTKAGDAKLTLSGSNTYTGDTTISKGTLMLGANYAIPATDLQVDADAMLDVNGKYAAVDHLFGGGTIDNKSGTAPGVFNINGGDFDGDLCATGGGLFLRKVSAEDFIFDGTTSISMQVYNGTLKPTTDNVDFGCLEISSPGKLDMNGHDVASSTLEGTGIVDNSQDDSVTYTLHGNYTSIFSGVIQNSSGVVSFVVADPSNIFLSGANTYSGDTTIDGCLLVAGDDAPAARRRQG